MTLRKKKKYQQMRLVPNWEKQKKKNKQNVSNQMEN